MAIAKSEKFTTLTEMFFARAERHASKKFIWNQFSKNWIGVSYAEVASQVLTLASGLMARGVNKGDRVVLVLENSLEWVVADLAIMAMGGITVPVFISTTESDYFHILEDCEAVAVICSGHKLADRVERAAERAAACRLMVVMNDSMTIHQPAGLAVITWGQLMKDGANYPSDILAINKKMKSQHVACLIYTSGSDSLPKGVMLTHKSILHNVYGAHARFSSLISKNEVFLSILPLSHAYEHTTGLYLPIYLGAEIYHLNAPERLLQTLREVRPTMMTTVPRLCELMHDRIRSSINVTAPMMQRLIALTLAHEQNNLWTHLIVPLAKPYIKKWVNDFFGGRLKLMVSGGAAMPPHVSRFFVSLGVRLVQGYGQTEASPVISVSPPENNRHDSVGLPLDGVRVKASSTGEILVKGNLVMKGYWNNSAETGRVIKNGWLHTGDLGEIDKDGFITITGRRKDVIVNSGGENISPSKVEARLTSQPNIEQAMVDGDKKPWLAAVIVPSDECVKSSDGRRDKIMAKIQDDIDTANAGLGTAERVRKFTIADDGFTIDNKRLTQTLKLRRHIIRQDFRSQIDRLYANR